VHFDNLIIIKRFLFAHIGKKKDAKNILGLLLESRELPSENWKQLGEQTWRTGVQAKSNEISARARENKSITAWRSFRRGKQEGFFIQITPFASYEDAIDATQDFANLIMPNFRVKTKVVSRKLVSLTSEVDLDHPRLIEFTTLTADGNNGLSKSISAVVGNFGFFILFESLTINTWDQVLEIAVLQSNKIKTLTMTKDDV
jgi:hypothetical protein